MSLVEKVQFKQPLFTVNLDPKAFENAIATQGVKLIHYRAFRCPVGMVDLHDSRRPDHDHVGCSNGFMHREAGTLRALFTGNGENFTSNDVGFVDGSTVSCTFQRFYEDNDKEVFIALYDRFYLDDEALLVPTWETFESSATQRERLAFPVVKVQDLMDSDGKEYTSGVDFEVANGYIQWTGNRPRLNPETGRGLVCTARYTYRPHWICSRLLHQIRFAQVPDLLTGERPITRMPSGAILVREYVRNVVDGDADENTQDKVPSPANGPFGGQ